MYMKVSDAFVRLLIRVTITRALHCGITAYLTEILSLPSEALSSFALLFSISKSLTLALISTLDGIFAMQRNARVWRHIS